MDDPAFEDALTLLAQATATQPVPLGRYDVVGRLGRGGMGTVYEAVDHERQAKVALKTLSAANATEAVWLKQEFRTVADLAHENLAPVYELASDRGIWFFTMELVEGVTLTDWARDGAYLDPIRPLPVSRTFTTTARSPLQPGQVPGEGSKAHADGSESDPSWGELVISSDSPDDAAAPSMPDRDVADVRRVFTQLVEGISALHGAGLRHGDIKPSNVLVRPDGRAVLVDFGLAQPLDTRSGGTRLRGGTPAYMPPEQLANEPVGPQADWYGLGACLYRVLTGCRPFVADSQLELYLKKTKRSPPPPHALLPELPVDLSELCLALMQPDDSRRPGRDQILRVLAGASEPPVATPERVRSTPFIGRDRELCTLEDAYGRARAGELTVVHMHGPSGIGKSSLLASFLEAVQEVDSALVLRGRCYERENVPYKGFDRIIDELAGRLRTMEPESLQSVLPTWADELARVFPALGSVPAIAERNGDVQLAGGAIELRRRGRTALAELLQGLRRKRPMVIAIDDLQWADVDSAELLVELLREDAPLLVVILYRPDAASENPALTGYFERCRRMHARGQLVDLPLKGLSLADAERLARVALGETSSAEHAAAIARESRGIPFFIEELVFLASEQRRRGADAEMSLDEAIRARVDALPADQRALIEVVAVANSPLPQSVVFEAAGLDAGTLMPLLALRRASMISWLGAGPDDVVWPYHDRIRESVLASLAPAATQTCHLELGRALARRKDEVGARLFEAVRHLGAAGPLLDDGERRMAAQLHAEAGEHARDAAAFPLAFDCFEGGIALLPDAWRDDYDLALRLHAGAVETAYLSANWDALRRRSEEFKSHSRTVMDQLVAWEAEIDAHAGRQDYTQAIDAGLTVLAMLGVELPGDPTQAEVGEAVTATIDRLTQVGPEGLRALPDLADPTAAAATRIQARLAPVAYFGRPLLLPIIACHLVDTSIERGGSPATPFALSLFGIVLNTLELYPMSHTWGQLAAEMLDRWPDRRLEAATRHILNNLVCNWMVPLSSTLGPLREVFDLGCRTGDYEYASYAAHGYVHNSMYAGRPLAALLDEALQLGEQMRKLGQVNALHVHVPFEQLLKAMIGQLDDPTTLDDASFSEAAHLAEAHAAGSRSGAYLMNHIKGYQLLLFGDCAQAVRRFEEATKYVDAVPSIWHLPIRLQHTALAACGAWDEADATARTHLRALADDNLAGLRRLADVAPINFAHRVGMVEGELARIEGDPGRALASFEDAITRAQEGGWINDVALANELAARCSDDPDAARRRLRAARTAYAAWGAAAKAKQIATKMAALA